jgi:hypothetical protein
VYAVGTSSHDVIAVALQDWIGSKELALLDSPEAVEAPTRVPWVGDIDGIARVHPRCRYNHRRLGQSREEREQD